MAARKLENVRKIGVYVNLPGLGDMLFITPLFRALKDIGYDGSIINENVAPGPDPFTPLKGENPIDAVETYLDESLHLMKMYEVVS